MSVSDDIRMLAREGMSVADIARHLGIRYQHAYGVLKTGGSRRSKPPLTIQDLIRGGFEFAGRWILSDADELEVDRPLPRESGVYAFANDGQVVYVGVATRGIADRLKAYAKPGKDQRTNHRLLALIVDELRSQSSIDIYTATPADFEWNGFPVNVCVGLEHGLIKKYALRWNKLNVR